MVSVRRVWRATLGLCLLTAIGLSGCRLTPRSADGSTAYVRLINAMPDAGGLDISVDGRRVWERSAFRSSTGYQAIAAGTYPVQIDADGLGTTLLTESLSFEKQRSYTLLALGQAESSRVPARVQVLPDEMPERREPDKAALRLINAAPGTPPLDLVVNAIVGVKSVAYGRRSPSLALSAGHYDLQIADASTPEMLSGAVGLDLAPGKSYTLIAMGRTGNGSLTLEVYPDRR